MPLDRRVIHIMSREVMTCVNAISLFVMIVTLNNCDTHLVIMYLLVMPITGSHVWLAVAALWRLLHCYKAGHSELNIQ